MKSAASLISSCFVSKSSIFEKGFRFFNLPEYWQLGRLILCKIERGLLKKRQFLLIEGKVIVIISVIVLFFLFEKLLIYATAFIIARRILLMTNTFWRGIVTCSAGVASCSKFLCSMIKVCHFVNLFISFTRFQIYIKHWQLKLDISWRHSVLWVAAFQYRLWHHDLK